MMDNKIISKEEIKEILKKYNIGKKPLSLLLGWGEVTIIRYLDGGIPDKLHSDVLYSIKNNVDKMFEYLENNKNLITEVAYKKVRKRIQELESVEDATNLNLLSKHIIVMLEETTPLALQKILYYIEGFCLALFDKEIFECESEAWVHGPVYREIYDKYSSYKFHSIDKENLDKYLNISSLDSEVMCVVDEVIKCFGCYSGKTLEKMTHLSKAWLLARDDIGEDVSSNAKISKELLKKEFMEICEEYHISDCRNIKKYSAKMFKKVFK